MKFVASLFYRQEAFLSRVTMKRLADLDDVERLRVAKVLFDSNRGFKVSKEV